MPETMLLKKPHHGRQRPRSKSIGDELSAETVAVEKVERSSGKGNPSESAARDKASKINLAKKINAFLTSSQSDLSLFLAGGGAATLLGGPRKINDLDFRINLSSHQSFREKDPSSQALIDHINQLLKENFKEVSQLERKDNAGKTISGRVENVEVSITRAPNDVPYLSTGKKSSQFPHLGEFDVILDKALAFVMRKDLEKRTTDLIDILSLIEEQPGLMSIFRFLNDQRGEVYNLQVQKSAQRSGKERDSNLLRQFHTELSKYFKKEAKRYMNNKPERKRFFPFIEEVVNATQEYLKDTTPIEVIKMIERKRSQSACF